MLQVRVMVLTLVSGIVVATSAVQAREAHKTPALKGVKCMFCGMPVSEKYAVDYKGGKVYFGCPACPPKFNKNRAKYAAEANAQLVATKQVRQKLCPVMGKPINPKLKMKIGDAEVYLCCPGCQKKLAQLSSDARIEKVFSNKVFAKAFAPIKHRHEPHQH